MRVLTGTDIIEINRIKDSIESLGETFKNKIYTEKKQSIVKVRKMQNTNIMLEDLQQKKLYLKQYQIYLMINLKYLGEMPKFQTMKTENRE